MNYLVITTNSCLKTINSSIITTISNCIFIDPENRSVYLCMVENKQKQNISYYVNNKNNWQ